MLHSFVVAQELKTAEGPQLVASCLGIDGEEDDISMMMKVGMFFFGGGRGKGRERRVEGGVAETSVDACGGG